MAPSNTHDLPKVSHAAIVHEAMATFDERVVVRGNNGRSTGSSDVSEDSLRTSVTANKGESRVRKATDRAKLRNFQN